MNNLRRRKTSLEIGRLSGELSMEMLGMEYLA